MDAVACLGHDNAIPVDHIDLSLSLAQFESGVQRAMHIEVDSLTEALCPAGQRRLAENSHVIVLLLETVKIRTAVSCVFSLMKILVHLMSLRIRQCAIVHVRLHASVNWAMQKYVRVVEFFQV